MERFRVTLGEGVWQRGRGCGPGRRGVAQGEGVWPRAKGCGPGGVAGGVQKLQKIFFFKILKNRHNTKKA